MAATWQYRTDEGKWSNFLKKDMTALEKAWAASPTTAAAAAAPPLSLTIRGHAYTIDLNHMLQKNAETGTERLIRRVAPDGVTTTAATRKAVWEWEAKHGAVWTPYDDATSDAIERAFLKDELHVTVPNVATGAHDAHNMKIHFGHMRQMHEDTTKERRVRRVMKDVVVTTGPPAVVTGPALVAPASVSTVPVATADSKKRERAPSPVKATPAGATAAAAAAAATSLPVLSGPKVALPPFAPSATGWQKEGTVLYKNHIDALDSSPAAATSAGVKVCGFDMDDALIYPKSGGVFPKNRADWQWLVPSVPEKLRELRANGYRVVIFTNQAGIGNKGWDEAKANEIRGKIDDVAAAVGIPITALIATKEDDQRKPGTSMWELFCNKLLAGTAASTVDMSRSFFVGDAAGRAITTLAGRKKDFSCSDRKFAYNLGLQFLTPEEFFAGKAPVKDFHWDGLSPDDLKAIPTAYDRAHYHAPPHVPAEMIIMVGFPGSGKSSFFARMLAPHGYQHINRDTLKTIEKCVAAAGAHLAAGRRVVIDNTNPGPEERKPFIELAKKHGVPVRAFVMLADHKLSNHMNIMRARLGITPRVSSIAYNIFKSKFQSPSAAEGFSEVVSIPAIADFTGLPEIARTYFYQLS